MNRQSLILIAGCLLLAACSTHTPAASTRTVVRTSIQALPVDGSRIEFVLVDDEAYSPPVLLLDM